MPRFYIDINDGDRHVTDAEGGHFVSEQEAIAVATTAFRLCVGSEANVSGTRHYRLTIRSENGDTVFETSLTATARSRH